MTSPFEKHNIDHLSWSSLKLYRAEPALWVLKYLHGVKDDFGPAAWRGKAVEAGLDWYLYKRDATQALEAATQQYDNEYQAYTERTAGVVPDKLDDEADLIPGMLEQAIAKAADWPTPVARQHKIEYWIDSIEVPVIGYVDYLFEDWLLDLKTTKACPSAPKPEDARQVMIYEAATGKAPKLLYVTAKRSEVYPVNDYGEGLADVARLACSVRSLLERCDKNEALAIHAPNFEAFYWNNELREAWERVAAGG